MRVAVYHNLPSGGAKRALCEWTRRLADSHTIDVFTLSSADHAFADIRPFVQNQYVFDFSPHKEFVSPWGRLNRLQRWRDLRELARVGRDIAHKIDSSGYDVLFAHPCLYTFIPIFLRFLRTPGVYYLHEPFGRSTERVFQRPYQKRQSRWRELSRRLDPLFILYDHRLTSDRVRSIGRTTCLLANSEFTQRSMKVEYGVDAPVCYCGVDTQRFHPMPSVRKEDHVISVGELTPRKGFDFLIESLGQIPADRRCPLKLVCNRENSRERQYLEALAADYGVALQVLIGLDTEQLTLEYNKARICLYSPVREPFGLVPLESMACGTPVVGVAEGGVCESIHHGESGLLTDRNPERFADAILELLDNPSLVETLGEQGVDYVREHWSWEDSAACLESHLVATANRSSQ